MNARFMLGTALALVLTAHTAAPANVVHVLNWSDYIDPSILEDFKRDTGIAVVYDLMDSNDILETKLLAGHSGYDVVVPSASFLIREVQAGVFQKLDQAKLPNYHHLWDFILKHTERYDPGNTYSANYMWGTTGIGYNVEKLRARLPDAPLNSWRLIFDPQVISRFADCGVYVLDAADELIPAALIYLGEDPNSHDPKVITKAIETLTRIRPFIQKFDSTQYINALANGDICLAVGWSGDILQARDRAREAGKALIQYVIPQEGALMWFDQLAIPKDAPHPEAAHAFINYLLKPEIAAKAANAVNYATGNQAAQPLLKAELRTDPAIYPPPETLSKLYTVTPYPPKVQRLVTRLWTRLKSGR